MKKFLIFLCFAMILACAARYEEEDLIGTWYAISQTDTETGESQKFEEDEVYKVEIRTDSLYVGGEGYAWELERDSIRVYVYGSSWSFHIKKLSGKKILVEDKGWFDDSILITEFEKRK